MKRGGARPGAGRKPKGYVRPSAFTENAATPSPEDEFTLPAKRPYNRVAPRKPEPKVNYTVQKGAGTKSPVNYDRFAPRAGSGRPSPLEMLQEEQKTLRPREILWLEAQLRQCRDFPSIENEGAELFNLPIDTIREWISGILKEWSVSLAAQHSGERARIIVAIQELYNAAMRAGDLRAAVATMDRLIRVLGLLEHETESVVGASSFKNPDSVRDRMSELMKDPAVKGRLEMLVRQAEAQQNPPN